MKRATVLGALVFVGLATAVVAGGQQPAAQADKPKVVEVEKLKDNFFVLRGAGGGGNTAVFVASKGVVVVDTKNPGWGQPILDKIKELTDKPVTMIINTHTHGDHVSGNVEFPTTVDVVAHENAAASMKRMKGTNGNIFDNNQGRGLPKRTYKDKLTLMSGPDQIDLYYFGRGHTDGDTWVVFPALRIMHAGDIFSGKNLPLLDGNNGGTGLEIGDTLAKAHAGVEERRHDRHRSQRSDDDGGSEGVFGLQQGLPGVRAERQEGGAVARSDCRGVGDSGQVHRLRGAGGGAAAGERRVDLRRDQVTGALGAPVRQVHWVRCGAQVH